MTMQGRSNRERGRQSSGSAGGAQAPLDMGEKKALKADLSQVASKLKSTPHNPQGMKKKTDVKAKTARSNGPAGQAPTEKKGAKGKAKPGNEKAKQDAKAKDASKPEPKGKNAKNAKKPGEGGGPKPGEKLDVKNKDKMADAVGADASNTDFVYDPDAAKKEGAAAYVKDPSKVVVGKEAMKDGKVKPDVAAHELAHVGQKQRGASGSSGAMAVPSGMSATGTASRGALEAEASQAASSYMSGRSFTPSLSASSGGTYRVESGGSATSETTEKVKLPESQNMALQAKSFQASLGANAGKEVEKEAEESVSIPSIAGTPDWLDVSNVSMTYKGDKLKNGTCSYTFKKPQMAPGVTLEGFPEQAHEGSFGEDGKISAEPPKGFKIDIAALGSVEVTDVSLGEDGLNFTAKLTPTCLTNLAQKTFGGEVTGGEFTFKHENGKIELTGNANAKVNAKEIQVLDLELKAGGIDDFEVKAKIAPNIRMLSSVELSGSYNSEGWSIQGNFDANNAQGLGDKFSIGGTAEIGYSTADGFHFAGGFEADLKVGEASFNGQLTVGELGDFDAFGAKGSLSGDIPVKEGIKLGGKVEGSLGFINGKVMGEGELNGEFGENLKAKIPVKYEEGKWSATPEVTVENWAIPGTELPKKEFKPEIPRIRIPIFGPFVVEGGATFDASMGLGPAEVKTATVTIGLDLNKSGLEMLTKANVKGTLECPFEAEAALGLQLGVGINLVFADGGAGIEGRARVGAPAGDDTNRLKVDLEADLISDEGMSFESNFDFNATIEGALDLNVYARYDTWLTREKIYRKNIASYNLFDPMSVGAKGGLKYQKGKGISANGNVDWTLPSVPRLSADKLKSLIPDW